MSKLRDKIENIINIGGTPRDIVCLIISGIVLITDLITPDNVLPFPISWIAVCLCGIPILLDAAVGLLTEFDIKADVLVASAIIASLYIGEYFAAGEVAFIMQLGSLLENLTVAKSRAGIERLVRLTPQTARIICSDGQEQIIPAEEVRIGDKIRVLPGETIPVDGIILSGETSVNQSVMTGESLPTDKSSGDEVFSGTINQFGAFEMQASKIGSDSSIQRMISLVKSADADKAKIVGIADRWATWVTVIALTAAVLTWLFTGQIIRAVTVLVVFCPCSLVLATPTAVTAAIGNVTKYGFLVREGDALERLASVSQLCLDKTGTLTYGQPTVTAVHSLCDMSDEEIESLTAAAEQFSEHPLGKAIVRSYLETHSEIPAADTFRMTAGRGVSVITDGRTVFAGSEHFLRENGIDIPEQVIDETSQYRSEGSTVIYTCIESRLAGYHILSDTLREDSRSVISQLSRQGISTTLLTGDNSKAADHIASLLEIDNVRSECLPEDKMQYITQSCQSGTLTAMIGDGINDAPALKASHLGIAMGGIGSDIAVEAADIVLINDEIKGLPHLFAIARRMMTTIRINMTFSMTLNFAAIALAVSGLLNPVVGALVHNAGSVIVIINSALLLRWKLK